MKTSAQTFYLAVYALLGSSCGVSASKPASASRSISASPDVCTISPRAMVSDACASYATLDEINEELKASLQEVTQTTDFFSYYRLNLFHKSCPFWNDENGMCGNIACAVNTLDNENDIPPIWRADELGKLSGPKAEHPGKRQQQERGKEKPLQGELGEGVGESCVVEYDDECDERDYCVPEDESATGQGDYVSLLDNPERFTGYSGEGAKQVWDAIYRENCFSRASFPHSADLGDGFSLPGTAAMDLRSVLEDGWRQTALQELQKISPNTPFVAENPFDLEDECLEKRVFYRVISGMHTSISTHLCWDYLNQTTGEWGPNVQCYLDRLHGHPERISNLYFNYALVLRAVAKLGPYLKDYTFCSGDPTQDRVTKWKVAALTSKAAAGPQVFDESLMFVNGEGPSLKEEFRNRFRNVSRIMDCVGCDKCRLWGKVQTSGYGTALKVLFEFHEDSDSNPQLKRTELVALFNTFNRISHSLTAIGAFRSMVEEASDIEEKKTISDRVKKPHNVVPQGDFDDFEEDGEVIKKHQPKEQTLGEMVWEETILVLKVYKFVLMSYVQLPRKLWLIFIAEMSRVYQWFIGVPVSPRQWAIERPALHEL